MQYNRLGRTGIRVSEVALGTMTFGKETDEPTAVSMVSHYLEAGGNVVDTADAYNGGLAEEILGKALAGRRDGVVLCTKARFSTGPGCNDRGASRRHLLDSVHDSLRRLGTDRIDLYQMHCWDPQVELEETLSTLDTLVQSGKVRYIGASNYAGWQLAKALGLSARHGWERFAALQAQYSLVCRGAERELLPLCEEERLGVLVWSPLAGGVLTGKYAWDGPWAKGTRAADSEARNSATMRDRFTARGRSVVDAVVEFAGEAGLTPQQVALRWVLGRPGVSSTILGARTLEQLQGNLAALGGRLTGDVLKVLDGISEPEPEYPYDFLEHARSA